MADESADAIVLKLAKTMDGCQAKAHVKIAAALHLAFCLMDFAGFDRKTMLTLMNTTVIDNIKSKRIIHEGGRA